MHEHNLNHSFAITVRDPDNNRKNDGKEPSNTKNLSHNVLLFPFEPKIHKTVRQW